MNWPRQLFSRRLYRDLPEEIQAHLDEKVEELITEGMSREEAMQSARREFGNLGLIEENRREVWIWPSVENFLLDFRHGLRALRHNPVFTTVALLTIAIGIAANAVVFTVVNSVLLRPLNYPKADELLTLHQIAPGAEGLADFENGLLLSPSMCFTYAEHNRTFQSLGVWIAGTANVTGLWADLDPDREEFLRYPARSRLGYCLRLPIPFAKFFGEIRVEGYRISMQSRLFKSRMN